MEGLWEYLLDGTITMIGSDHAPLTMEEKTIGEQEGIWKAFSGFPGVEVMLPVMLTQVNAGPADFAAIGAPDVGEYCPALWHVPA